MVKARAASGRAKPAAAGSAPRRPGALIRLAGAAGAAVLAHPVPVLAVMGGAAAMTAVYVNVVVMQPGPHPAPLFQTRPFATDPNALPPATNSLPIGAAARGDLVRDLQEALADRGYAIAKINGLLDASTIAAIQAFERAQKLPLTGEPSEALLARVLVAAPPAATKPATAAAIAVADGGQTEVKRVQKALADLGYGPLKIDGRMGGQTASAIRRFRADHGLPAGDQIDAKLTRTLISIGGMPKA